MDLDNRFEYYIMVVGASIQWFQHMQLMVAVDETFLKTRYSGILYIASYLDKNEQIHLLAFGLRPSEMMLHIRDFFQNLGRSLETMLI